MFHLALPVVDIEQTTNFYLNVLKARIGRSATNWADFDFHGNQLTFHQMGNFKKEIPRMGKEGNPIKHFGVILTLEEWEKEKNRFEALHIRFLSEPKIVFEGMVGEQYSFFIKDPNGYAIEYKGFKNLNTVFKSA
ncbi:MAG TPA: glyoxalase [Flavobacteriales bacterium]|nr:glyoxalase [Flavobacteriales bacterium]